MSRSACRFATAAAVVFLLAASGAVRAQSFDEDTFLFEVYAGQYQPEPSFLDDETTFGLRGGFMAGRRLALIGSVGRTEFDDTVTDGKTTVDFELETWVIDFTAAYIFRPDKKLGIAVGGGIGGAFSSLDADIATPVVGISLEDFESDSLTFNVVLGPIIHLSERLYLKPSFRARMYEDRDDDEVDTEATLALGFKF